MQQLLAQAPSTYLRREILGLLLAAMSMSSARETFVTRLGTGGGAAAGPALPAESVSMAYMSHVTLERQKVENAGSNISPSDDSCDGLSMNRVSSEEETRDGDGYVGWEQQPGQTDYQTRC